MAKHTAIVYFHGIGAQRRHEEISRLLDAIDQYTSTQDGERIGHPRGQKVNFEILRSKHGENNDEKVSYISFHRRVEISKETLDRIAKDGGNKPNPFRGAYRLYEGYWSSIIAGGLPPRLVLKWIARRATNPISSILAPWRSHQRLKLTYLFRLHRDDPLGGTTNNSLYRGIADAYIQFESWDARRKFGRGHFKQFVGPYLDRSRLAERNDFPKVRRAAKRWRRTFLFSQIRIFFHIITLFAGLFGAATFALFSIAPLLSEKIFNLPFANEIVSWMPTQPDARLVFLMFPTLLIGTWIVRNFLKKYVSDVVFWTAREGSSELFERRQVILQKAVSTLEHVMNDPDCNRVVVIGHSLGTSIGYQALLEIWMHREALGRSTSDAIARFPYEKISHFITAGSPIETLHYFFELTDSKHHRYNRIANDVKGSIEGAPFVLGRKKSIQWVNLHASADPISSELFSPGKSKVPDIEEIEVVSQIEPHVGKAHSGYFTATPAVARIHDAIMLNDHIRTSPKKPPKWGVQLARIGTRVFRLTNTFMAWTLFLAATFFWLGHTRLLDHTLLVFLATSSFLATLWAGLTFANRFVSLNVGDQLRPLD